MLKDGPTGRVLQVADQRLDINVQKMRMRLNNLFNGDAVLGIYLFTYHIYLIHTFNKKGFHITLTIIGETVNTFLNENSQEVFKEVKPEISKQVGDLVLRVMNDALASLPVDKFLSTKKQKS